MIISYLGLPMGNEDRRKERRERRERERRRRRDPDRKPGPIRKLFSLGKLFLVLKNQPIGILAILGAIVAIVWYFATR